MILDEYGKVFRRLRTNKSECKISTNGLNSGFYFISFEEDETKKETLKFVIDDQILRIPLHLLPRFGNFALNINYG